MNKSATIITILMCLSMSAHSDSAEIAKGKSLFIGCAGCHGSNGDGSKMLSTPKISDKRPPFIFKRYKSLSGHQPHLQRYSDQNLKALAAYIDTLKTQL